MSPGPLSSNPKKHFSATAIVGLCCAAIVTIVGFTGIALRWRIRQNAPQLRKHVQAQTEPVSRSGSDQPAISISADAGTLPSWFPAYPGSEMRPGNMNVRTSEGRTGVLQFATDDSMAKVLSFYEAALFEAHFATEMNRTGGEGDETRLSGIKEDGKFTIMLIIHRENRGTVVMASYQEPSS